MSEQFFKHEEEKGPNPVKKKKKGIKKPINIHTCDSLAYNAFLEYYYEKKYEKLIKLECDLIKPKLSSVSEVLCKTFGQYIIQFGIQVFHNFIKYLFNIKKKQNKGFLPNILKVQINRVVNRFKKKGGNKAKIRNKIIQLIDGFYKLNCKKIMPHYNAFYVFYNENEYSKKHTNIIKTTTCDYYRHIGIPRIEA